MAIFEEVIQLVTFFFGAVGAAIIIYGGLTATLRTLMLEILKRPLHYNDIRKDFTNKIIFGLDFFIAADVLKTLISPLLEEIILLGAVVGIRTILAYFLNKEAQEVQTNRF
jgi:uncharacterized membrane protein